MKFFRILSQVLLFLLIFTSISFYIQYKNILFERKCLVKYENKINPPCNEAKFVDTLLALPVETVRKFTKVEFTCEGISIGYLPRITLKSNCENN